MSGAVEIEALPQTPKFSQEKFGEADPLYQRVLEIDEKVYGPGHPEVAADLTTWAAMLMSQVSAL